VKNVAHRTLFLSYDSMEASKGCSVCKRTTPLSMFNKDRSTSDGLERRCKECNSVKSKEYHAKHKNKVSQRKKNRRLNDEEHRLSDNEKARGWHADHRARSHDNNRRWHENNRDKATEKQRRRYLVKKGVEGSHTTQEWEELKAFYDNRCLGCGSTESVLTRDHVVPITKGGSDYIHNIQPLCTPCNSSKRQKTIDYRINHG
jgi:hypothetical protein